MLLLSRFTVSGHSMRPTFYAGDIVLVSRLPYVFQNPKIGDIIVFKNNGKQIIKRIVKIKDGKYVVSGDNTRDSKNFPPIEKKDILGKVIFKIP